MPENPELRRDPLTGDWTVIAGGRNRRPTLPEGDCPFCVGGVEAPEQYVVRAFANRWPPLVPGDPPAGGEATPARGASEVVLYSPDHDQTFATLTLAQARRVVDLWAERSTALRERPEVAYVLVFENRGVSVGQTISHPHGQIYGFPFVPPVAVQEAERSSMTSCALCKPAGAERLVIASDGWTATVPFAAGYPFELLLQCDRHVPELSELSSYERDGLAAALIDLLGRYDRLFERPSPYMFWVHPGFHLHLHLVGLIRGVNPDGSLKERYVAAGELGSGVLFNPIRPEDAAARLRSLS